jgi:hypothetical protein
MKKLLRSIIAGLLSIQMLALPVMTVECLAEPVDASAPSSSPSSFPSLFTSPGGGGSMQQMGPGYGTPQDTYFTDNLGNILMYVNVWGSVYKPGQYIVREGADIATALSLAGGPNDNANLSKVRVNRQSPDENGKQSYQVNLKKYTKEGDRAVLVDLKPNDTIIIPENKGIDRGTILQIIGIAVSIVSVIVWSNN